jgi:hypothetical protein
MVTPMECARGELKPAEPGGSALTPSILSFQETLRGYYYGWEMRGGYMGSSQMQPLLSMTPAPTKAVTELGATRRLRGEPLALHSLDLHNCSSHHHKQTRELVRNRVLAVQTQVQGKSPTA